MKKIIFSMLILLTGCATNIIKPNIAPMPAKVPLSTFEKYELAPVAAAPDVLKSNQKAIKKINELMISGFQNSFPGIIVKVDSPAMFSKNSKTLLIEPTIKAIKFIGGAARFWVGPIAGASAVTMAIVCRDAATGDIIAQGEFYRQANAAAGSMTNGITDNLMLDNITQDIIQYIKRNL